MYQKDNIKTIPLALCKTNTFLKKLVWLFKLLPLVYEVHFHLL